MKWTLDNNGDWYSHHNPFAFFVFDDKEAGACAVMHYGSVTESWQQFATVEEAKEACLRYAQVQSQSQLDFFTKAKRENPA